MLVLVLISAFLCIGITVAESSCEFKPISYVELNTQACIRCPLRHDAKSTSSSSSITNVRWTYTNSIRRLENVPLPNNVRYRIDNNDDNILIIDNVTVSDGGDYVCHLGKYKMYMTLVPYTVHSIVSPTSISCNTSYRNATVQAYRWYEAPYGDRYNDVANVLYDTDINISDDESTLHVAEIRMDVQPTTYICEMTVVPSNCRYINTMFESHVFDVHYP